MLYDPKWNKEGLEGFIAWLETKDSEATYDWTRYQSCATGQYLKAIGAYRAPVSEMEIARRLSYIAHPGSGPLDHCTFGGCLDRARKVLTR
jgi:hypothetical protein